MNHPKSNLVNVDKIQNGEMAAFLSSLPYLEDIAVQGLAEIAYYRHGRWFYEQLVRRVGCEEIIQRSDEKTQTFCRSMGITYDDFRLALQLALVERKTATRDALDGLVQSLDPLDHALFLDLLSCKTFHEIAALQLQREPRRMNAILQKIAVICDRYRMEYFRVRDIACSFFVN